MSYEHCPVAGNAVATTGAADPAEPHHPDAGACGKTRMSSISGMSAKPPNLSKTDASHKDGLISKQRSSERIDASNKTFPPDDRRAPIVEATVECAAGRLYRFLRFFPMRFQVLGTQLGIGVVKAEERPARFGSSSIHLSAARGFVAGNQADEASTVQLAKAFRQAERRPPPTQQVLGRLADRSRDQRRGRHPSRPERSS